MTDILIPSNKKNIILDATMLSSLMSCFRMSDFRFNMHLQPIGGKSNSLETGSIAHKFLEVYYRSRIIHLSKSQAEGFAFAAAELYIQGCKDCAGFISIDNSKPSCNHQPNEYPGVTNTPKESEGYLIGWHWVLDTCKQYLDFYKNDFWEPLEIEIVKGDILYEDDEIRILWKSKLDSIFNTNQFIIPMDHKTMKQNRDNVSLNNQFIGQCLVTKSPRMVINKVGFQKTLPPEEKFKREFITYSPSRLLEWQSQILPHYAHLLVNYTEMGYFPPNFTSCETKYGKCAFINVCSGNEDDRERLLKESFMVGPVWNPTNEDISNDT